ncbi:hypothetical protein EJB05_40182, partial [Eragrostis curvula]
MATCHGVLILQIQFIDALVYYSPTVFRNAGMTTDRQLLAASRPPSRSSCARRPWGSAWR